MIYYDSPDLKRSRFMFMLQAAFEYLVSILMVEGTFLAELTDALGFNDAQTGVLYSIISLGCLFQILSLFFRRGSVKRFAIYMSILNQILFLLLYIIPDVPISASLKRIVFVVFVVLAYAGLYTSNPKINYWRVSLIEPNRRGRYNGWMQIISLILGMTFSYGMGAVVDHYKNLQNTTGVDYMPTIFRICAITIFVLLILHLITLLSIVELPSEEKEEKRENIFKSILNVVMDKRVLLLVGVFILWNIAQYSAMPFYKTYQLEELKMHQTTIQILTAVVGGIIQMAVAMPIGWVGDKFSFPKMLLVCLAFMFLRCFVVIFATPENGVFCFVLYNIFNSVPYVGALCALMNCVFSAVPENMRADSFALCQSAGGICGFITSLVMGGLVTKIQENGNQFLGMNVYAQQVVSVISCIFALIAMLYVVFVIEKKAK